MNERIQALIEQCKHTSTTYFDGRGNVTETYFDKEKFAGLIVKKCASIYARIDNGNEHLGTTEYLEALRKHFGVE